MINSIEKSYEKELKKMDSKDFRKNLKDTRIHDLIVDGELNIIG